MILDEMKQDMKTAMKSKDNTTRDTLRLLLAAVKQAEVDQRKELSNNDVLQLLQKQAKQRRESIHEYEKANRSDLADPEKVELAVVEKYLPQMMGREEIKSIAADIVANVDTSNPKAMGVIMGQLMPKVKGKADGRLVNEVVRELLNG